MNKKVDFLPEDYLDKKAQRRTNVVCLTMFLLVVGSVGTGFLYTQQRQQKFKKQIDHVNNQMLMASESLKQLDELEAKKKKMMTKASICCTLMEMCPRSLLLATLTNDLPQGVSLVDFEMESKEIKAPRAEPVRSRSKKKIARTSKKEEMDLTPPRVETTVEFTGLAPTDIEVARLISNLDRCDMFREVNLMQSEEHDIKDEIVRQFTVQVKLDPDYQASMKDVEMARNQHISGM